MANGDPLAALRALAGLEDPEDPLDQLRELAGVGTDVASPPPVMGVEPVAPASTAIAPAEPARLAGPDPDTLDVLRDDPVSDRVRSARERSRFRAGYTPPRGPLVRSEPDRLAARLGIPTVQPGKALLEDRPTPQPDAPLETGALVPPETRVPDPARPGEFYRQEAPDVLREEVAYGADPTRFERLKSDITALARGGVNMGTLGMKGVAELDAIIAKRIGVGPEDATEADLYKLAEDLERWSDEHLAGDPRLRDRFRTKLAEGFGSAVPFLAVTAATGGAGAAGLGVGVGAGASAERARVAGGDVERAALLGGAVGSTEAVPFMRLFGRIRRAVPPGSLNRLRHAARGAAGQALEEGTQEAGAEVLYNAIARMDTPDQELFEGFVESYGIGAAVGLVLGGGAGLIGRTVEVPDPETGEVRPFKIEQAAFHIRGEDIPTGPAHDLDAALEGRPEGERRAIEDALADPDDDSVVSGFVDSEGRFLEAGQAQRLAGSERPESSFIAETEAGDPLRQEGLRGPQEGRQGAPDTVEPGPPVEGSTGAESTIKAADGSQAPVRYRVVEADRLTTSHNAETFAPNPAFPEGVQERRYHDDPVAQQRVVETTQNLDPDIVLDPTPGAVSGPPIVLPDGTVLSGNQRTMAIARAYRGVPERAEAYRQAIAETAERFGIDPAQVEGMERPVLVREFEAPHRDRAALAELSARFNETPTKARDPLADAAVRARRLREATPTLEHFASTIEPDQTVRQYVGTAAGRDFVNDLVQTGIITRQEAAKYLDKTGALNIEGKFLVERMMQLAAVGDPEVVARTPAFALRKIERAAPAIVRSSTVEGWGLAPTLREALDLLAAVRAHPDATTVQEYVAQVDAFGREFSEPAATLARVLESEGVVDVTERFRQYATDAEAFARQVETRDVFGHEPPGPEASFAERFGMEAERSGRLRGPQGAVGMPLGQGEMFGRPSPTEGGDQFGMGLEGPRGPEGVTQAERRARNTVDRLRPLVERGAVTPDQREEYRQAVALLRRNEALSEEEARLLADPLTEPDTESGTLLMPAQASQPESLTPPPEPGKPVSAPEVIEQLANVVKAAGGTAPIRTGRVPAGARGIFKVGPEVVRVREANDIPAAVHEVAHALEKQIIGNPADGPWKKRMAAAALQEELESLGRDLYGDTTPSNGHLSEGWAEYLRLWVTGPETARSKAPRFTEWFEGQFSDELPDVRNALDDAQDTARRWARQGSVLRAAAQTVDPASPRARLERAGKALTGGLYEKWVEAFQPLYKLAREAESRLERKLEPEEDPYTIASALRYRHSARVRYMVETGMLDIAGNRVGPALEDVRGLVAEAPVPKRYKKKLSRHQLFGIYLWARRAEKLHEDPKGARNPGLSLADARQVIEELDSEQFQRAASIVHEWNRGVLEYAAGKDTSDPEAGVQWRVPAFKAIMDRVLARDPGDYIPLKREMDELSSVWRSASKSASTRSPVSRLVGSGRRIKDPLQSMIAQAEQMVRATHERLVVDQIIKLSEVEGLGHLVEEVSPDQAPVAARTVDELVRELERRGALEEGTREALGDEAGELVTFFAPKRHPDTKEPIIPVHEDGRVRWLRVNTELYEALEGMDIWQAGPVVDWLLVKPASLFRAGTVGIRASFGLVTNPLRDWQSFITNTRSKRSPISPRLWWDLVRSMFESIGARTVGKRSEWADAFIRLGGEMTQPLGEDMPQARRAARRLTRKQRKLDELARSDLAKKLGVSKILELRTPADFYDAFRDLVQAPEAGPRIAEIKQVAEEVGWEPGRKMSLSQALQMSLAAGQVTTDFTAAGHYARVVNRAVPFFNAAIQGPRANIRAFRRNPMRVTFAIGMLMLAGIANWYRNKDEDWHKELSHRDKYRYWWVPVTTPSGETTLLRIPRAFELGAVAAAPEAILEQWYEEDPEAVEAWVRSTLEVSLPPGVEWPYPFVTGPVLGRLVVEQAANRRLYFDSPIVPRGEEDMPAEEQYSPYTTRASRVLGDVFNVSPRRLDHIRESILGRVSTDILDVLQIGRKPPEQEGEAADLPVVGVLFKRGGRYSYPKSVEDIYDELEQAQKRQRSGRLEESPRQRQLRLQLQDAANAISALSYVASHTEDRDQRHELNETISEIARAALDDYRAKEVRRKPWRNLRKSADREEEAAMERLRAMAGVK